MGGGISNSQVITDEGKYSLDAVQNNPEIEDTIAYKLSKLYSNIYYKSGDKISRQRLWTGGTLTTGSTDIIFTIPTHFISDATPKLTLIAVGVRYDDKYLAGSGDLLNTNLQGIDISYNYYEQAGIEVKLTKSAGFLPGVNNVPVAVHCFYSIDFV